MGTENGSNFFIGLSLFVRLSDAMFFFLPIVFSFPFFPSLSPSSILFRVAWAHEPLRGAAGEERQ